MRGSIRLVLVFASLAMARAALAAPTFEAGRMSWDGVTSSGAAGQVGLRGSPDHRGRPGVDFAFNAVISGGGTAFPLDLAVGVPEGSDRITIEPRFGGTLALGGGFGAWGWNGGVSVLYRTGRSTGISLGFTRRWMMGDPAKVVTWSSMMMGVAFALP
jgi:hypothetical protein